jgi:hypothetical protein
MYRTGSLSSGAAAEPPCTTGRDAEEIHEPRTVGTATDAPPSSTSDGTNELAVERAQAHDDALPVVVGGEVVRRRNSVTSSSDPSARTPQPTERSAWTRARDLAPSYVAVNGAPQCGRCSSLPRDRRRHPGRRRITGLMDPEGRGGPPGADR